MYELNVTDNLRTAISSANDVFSALQDAIDDVMSADADIDNAEDEWAEIWAEYSDTGADEYAEDSEIVDLTAQLKDHDNEVKMLLSRLQGPVTELRNALIDCKMALDESLDGEGLIESIKDTVEELAGIVQDADAVVEEVSDRVLRIQGEESESE